jgi:hypothetical protein
MSTIPGYEGPAHPLSSPIEALTAVSTADYNHRAVGIRSCENAFHLASTIVGGRDIVEEFVAARIWPISYGWALTEIVHFNVNWAAQQVPFPKFGIKLRDGQSAEDFMLEIKRRVTLKIGEYTMNEYKAYKALVKHKRRINRVFSKVCGDKSFPSQAENTYGCCCQLLSCSPQSPEMKILQEQLHDCRRDYILRRSTLENKVS